MSRSNKPDKWSSRGQRWLDVLLMTCLGLLFCVLFHKPLDALATLLGENLAYWSRWIQYATVATLSGVLWWFLIHLGGFRSKDLWKINTLCYPPTWLGGVLGGVLYLVLKQLFFTSTTVQASRFYWFDSWIFLAGILSAVIVKSVLSLPSDQRDKKEPEDKYDTNTDSSNPLLNKESLFKWLDNEAPVRTPAQDYFDAQQPARRICRHLLATPLKTIGILGAYGSGKSTILNLVEYYRKHFDELCTNLDTRQKEAITHDPKKLIVCRAGAWGFTKTSVARHILDCMLDELGKHIDVLAFSNLPEHYQAALVGSGSPWAKAVAGISKRKESPDVLLSHIDSALISTGLRVVVFVEDVDRNSDDNVFYQEIGALLDHLKNLQNLSFVLACGHEQKASALLARLCEHTEMVPTVSEQDFKEIFSCFYDSILAEYREDIPVSNYDLFQPTEQEESLKDFIFQGGDGIYNHLNRLLAVPRTFKKALRQTYHIYKNLHGEIDLNEVFVLTALRITLPDLYAFFAANRELIQSLSSSRDNSELIGFTEVKEEYKIRLKELMRDMPELKSSVNEVFQFLVDNQDRPQNIMHTTPTNYWVRLHAEEIPAGELRDQVVLKKIRAWQEDNTVDLPECFLSNTVWAQKVERLGRLFLSTGEIYVLTEQVFALIRRCKESDIEITCGQEKEQVAGLVELQRLLTPDKRGDYAQWIAQEMDKALAVDLKFTNSLFLFYCTASGLDSTEQERLMLDLIEKAKELFAGDVDHFVQIINTKRIYSLYRFIVALPKRINNKFHKKSYGGCLWLGDTLMKAAKRAPKIVIPQLMGLLWGDGDFNRQLFEALFFEKKDELMERLATDFDMSAWDSEDQAYIKRAQAEARKWLERQKVAEEETA